MSHLGAGSVYPTGGSGRGIWSQLDWAEWAARGRSIWRGLGGARIPFCWPDLLNQCLKGCWSSTSLSQLQRSRVQANLIVSLCQPKQPPEFMHPVQVFLSDAKPGKVGESRWNSGFAELNEEQNWKARLFGKSFVRTLGQEKALE